MAVDRVTLAAGALPLAAGALIPWTAVAHAAPLCPFRALTGLPCPLCGATRAFVLFGHLDGRWLDYGAVWVVAALALVLVAFLRHPRVPFVRAAAAVALLAWAWALTHASTITAT